MIKQYLSRLLSVPKTNETKEIEVPQMWEVRWTSRSGDFRSDTAPEVQGFYSLEAAEAFKESLKNAFKLLRYTSSKYLSSSLTEVTLNKVK